MADAGASVAYLGSLPLAIDADELETVRRSVAAHLHEFGSLYPEKDIGYVAARGRAVPVRPEARRLRPVGGRVVLSAHPRATPVTSPRPALRSAESVADPLPTTRPGHRPDTHRMPRP